MVSSGEASLAAIRIEWTSMDLAAGWFVKPGIFRPRRPSACCGSWFSRPWSAHGSRRELPCSWTRWLVLGIGDGHRFGDLALQDLADGEYWRLMTSTFVHFSVMHLVLNLIAMYQLGTMVESWYGSYQSVFIYGRHRRRGQSGIGDDSPCDRLESADSLRGGIGRDHGLGRAVRGRGAAVAHRVGLVVGAAHGFLHGRDRGDGGMSAAGYRQLGPRRAARSWESPWGSPIDDCCDAVNKPSAWGRGVVTGLVIAACTAAQAVADRREAPVRQEQTVLRRVSELERNYQVLARTALLVRRHADTKSVLKLLDGLSAGRGGPRADSRRAWQVAGDGSGRERRPTSRPSKHAKWTST